jgi:hypothetical protein
VALGFYVTRDRLWQKDGQAWEVIRTLPPEARDAILALDRRVNPAHTPWTWDKLLHRIACDQAYYRELEVMGPTEAGVVRTRTRPSDWSPLWERPAYQVQGYTLKPRTARRIYDEYSRQKSILLGLGMEPPVAWREGLRAHGLLDARGRLISAPLVSLWDTTPRREREKYVSVILHWFNHALRNLQRYRQRHDHDPLAWDTDACGLACLDAARRLMRRR